MEGEPTRDPETIKAWAEKHGAQPQYIDDPKMGDDPVLRFHFENGGDLEPMEQMEGRKDLSWDEFFDHFNEMNLEMVIDEDYRGDDPSNAYHFMKRSS